MVPTDEPEDNDAETVEDGAPDGTAHALERQVFTLRQALRRERQHRAEVEEHFAFLRGALEHSGEAMMITAADPTPPARRILYVNPAFTAMTGYTPEEVLGVSPRILWGEASDPAVVQSLRRCLETGQSFHGETWMRRKDGRQLLLAQHVAPVRGEDGALRYFVSIQRDVTPERAAQHAQRRMEAEANHARKLEALGRLASGIVHDFNNLLAAVLANAELLAETVGGEDREIVGEILRAAQHGRGLTQQLMVFCRHDPRAPQVIDVDEATRGALRMLRRLLGDGVRVETHLAAAPARARIDLTKFGQVLMNLCLNARDAMPAGGCLTVRTAADAARITVTVQDDGAGIDAADRAQMLEPFFTTKPDGEGAGLGLATVMAILEGNGGALRVETAPGQGTTMRVLLPRADEDEDAPDASEPPGAPAPFPARLLVVEDDDGLRAVVERALRRAGYAVTAAASPGEALLVAERDPRVIDLVLSDVAMPYLDGPSLVARLRAMRPGLRALFMSAHAEPEVLRACEGALLSKPFGVSELLARVAAAVV